MFLTGYKILFDGYLMIRRFSNEIPLIINDFLFDGYLMMDVNNSDFLCDRHVTGRAGLPKIPFIINHSLCDGYVTGRQNSYLMAILLKLKNDRQKRITTRLGNSKV